MGRRKLRKWLKGELEPAKREHAPMLTAALLTTAKLWKQRECPPIHEWIRALWYVYPVEHYMAIKNEVLPFTTS